MKRNSPEKLPSGDSETTDPLTQGDDLWDVLGKASEQKPDAFFARNVVRETRQLANSEPTWTERITQIFSGQKIILPLAAAACIGVVAVTQFNSDKPVSTQPDPTTTAQNSPAEDPSTTLAELVIEESLTAAAEDPSQFTHDELVAMVGL